MVRPPAVVVAILLASVSLGATQEDLARARLFFNDGKFDQAIEAAELARARDIDGLSELQERLAAAEQAPEQEPDTTELEQLAQADEAAWRDERESALIYRQ